MCLTEIVDAVMAVQTVEGLSLEGAKKRIPDVYKNYTFYTLYDTWVYKGVPSVEPGHEQCPWCADFDGGVFAGSTLRNTFPDHQVFSADRIYVNYHQTLWKKDTCKCYLYREGSGADPDIAFPFTDKPEPKKPEKTPLEKEVWVNLKT